MQYEKQRMEQKWASLQVWYPLVMGAVACRLLARVIFAVTVSLVACAFVLCVLTCP